MKAPEIAEKLAAAFGEAIIETDLEAVEPYCVVAPERLADVCAHCRDELGFDYLACLSGVDYLDKKKTTDDLGVVYHLESMSDATHRFTLKVRLSREEPNVPTVENIWRTADWHEREAWDMYGIIFEGHHDMRRILCAEDWVGHPLRKDYRSPATYHGIKNNVV